ncbi:MAG: hypothetical protein KDD43_06590 [Bdellovibrionales bacterium]|nr:hypothetical protein [Bdellovibrionales bacterium]
MNQCHHCHGSLKTYHYLVDGHRFCSASCLVKYEDEQLEPLLVRPVYAEETSQLDLFTDDVCHCKQCTDPP